MQSAFIITDRTQKPYAVVGLMPGGTEIYPITDAATEWASWMADEFAARKITKDELVATIDNSMDIEGPIANTRGNKIRLEELIRKAKKSPKAESDKPEEKHDDIEMLSLADVVLSDLSNDEWRNAVQFKAASFIADANKSTFAYEVKRTRATWDPSLSIPGTNRRGGWRCPVGTRYGGQITDRFGRNCGWGATRRLANAISDLGERLENVGDRRREGRVARRNERMVRRLREGGAIERGARAVARGLEGFEFDPANKPMERRRRRRGEVGGARGRQGGMLERAAGRLADVLGEDAQPPRRPRDGNLRPSEARRIERELEQPGAPRTPRQPRPDAARPLPQGRRPGGNDIVNQRQRSIEAQRRMFDAEKARLREQRPNGVSDKDWRDYQKFLDNHEPRLGYGGNDDFSIPSFEEWNRTRIRPEDVNPAARPANRAPRPQQPEAPSMRNTRPPAGAPRPGETLEQYKRRKYNEHQANVRKIREEGGNAGFLKYDEWDAFHGPVVEENWKKGQGKGRAQRRTSADNVAKPKATRRPKAEDKPLDKQPPKKNPRKPFKAENPRAFNDEIAAKRARNKLERENAEGDFRIVKHNDKYFVVRKEEIDRANANGANLEVVQEPPRPARRPPAPDKAPKPDTPKAPDTTPKPNTPKAPEASDAPKPSSPGNAINPRDVRRPNTGIHGNATDRFNQKMGYKVVDGVLVPEHVPTGANNINNAADAKRHLENGGSLDDVPDMLVKQAIFDNAAMPGQPLNGKRFELKGDPSDGINNRGQAEVKNKTYVVIDKVTGKRYIMKSPSFVEDEAIGEQYAGIIGQLGGRPMARVRIIGGRERRENREGARRGRGVSNNHTILVEHFGDVHGMDVREGLNGPTKPDRAARKHVKFIDAVLGNGDRHVNNYMWAGDQKLPIDHGILPGGNGIIPNRDIDSARRIWSTVDAPQIRENFRNLSDSEIDNIVAALKKHWLDVGVPADKVTRNATNMGATLRNLAQAARE